MDGWMDGWMEVRAGWSCGVVYACVHGRLCYVCDYLQESELCVRIEPERGEVRIDGRRTKLAKIELQLGAQMRREGRRV